MTAGNIYGVSNVIHPLGRASRGRGFTLIELLVVIAIIAILASLIAPSLGRTRVYARRVKCTSNMKQIAGAMMMYLSEHEGEFPPKIGGSQYSWVGKAGEGGYGSTHMLPRNRPFNAYLGEDYEDDEEIPIARCPSDYGRHLVWGDSEPLYDFSGTSYGSNTLTGDRSSQTTHASPFTGIVKNTLVEHPYTDDQGNQLMSGPWFRGRNMSEIKYPVRMIVMAELGAYVAQWGENGVFRPDHIWAFDYHDKLYHHNVIFADGHADFIKIPQKTYVTETYSFHYQM
jgi:prepilin-type N-terminal cleavage/methylation domain-containing protein